MKSVIALGALLLLPHGAGAAPPRFFVEPAQVGLERLDAVHTVSGLQSRSAVRLGGAAGIAFWDHWQLALVAGTAAGTTDFGLLDGTTARLVRSDATLEVRGRVPVTWHGFAVQGGLGVGRLSLGYRPDQITLDVEGTPVVVELSPVRVWSQQVAAEVLHGVAGGEMGLRCGWRFYALDVSTPAGVVSHAARDLQLGLVVRVTVF